MTNKSVPHFHILGPTCLRFHDQIISNLYSSFLIRHTIGLKLENWDWWFFLFFSFVLGFVNILGVNSIIVVRVGSMPAFDECFHTKERLINKWSEAIE